MEFISLTLKLEKLFVCHQAHFLKVHKGTLKVKSCEGEATEFIIQ